MSKMLTDLLLVCGALAAVVGAVTALRILARLQRWESRLDEVTEGLARVGSRLERLERHIDEYWRGVETRIGKIHETFESGRACRMGGTVAGVDLRMAHLNRKMEEILERMPRPGLEGEAP